MKITFKIVKNLICIKKLLSLLDNIDNNIKNTNNLILYGPSGTGKYTQALNYIKRFSPTNLRFERKMNFNYDSKSDFIFKISDIHFEIDMSLLGCKAKLVFNDLYYHILDVLSSRPNGSGIILCKNFHIFIVNYWRFSIVICKL